jgi:uncharacterized protein
MQHKQLDATTTAVDQELGTFEAIVSAWDADREGDTIALTAFDRTIEAWQRSGKNLPLLFEHTSAAIGHVDPFSMHATEPGLVVAGEVDRSTEKGQQVWRQVKSGTVGFSIGFMSESRPRKGGGRELVEIDLLEISATSKPMHPATRALNWKHAAEPQSAAAREMAAIINEAWDETLADPDLELGAKAAKLGVEEMAHRARPIRVARFDA